MNIFRHPLRINLLQYRKHEIRYFSHDRGLKRHPGSNVQPETEMSHANTFITRYFIGNLQHGLRLWAITTSSLWSQDHHV